MPMHCMVARTNCSGWNMYTPRDLDTIKRSAPVMVIKSSKRWAYKNLETARKTRQVTSKMVIQFW